MATTTYSADMALAEALAKLKSVEEDNVGLKAKLKQLAGDPRMVEKGESSGRVETERLRKQNSEVSALG